jgi:BNR repeat-like domain
MDIVDRGYVSRCVAGTDRAVLGFPSVTALADGTLLASCRCGTTKDSADEVVEVFRSSDRRIWRGPVHHFGATRVLGRLGSIKVCHFTELGSNRLLAAALWVDRESYPGKPLFNPETEGCLPMAILLADSVDSGATWSEWRNIPMPEEIGPPSLTSPLLRIADGRLALSVENNKTYEDRSKWLQRVVLFHSADGGLTWSGPVTAGADPTGRIFNWDQRVAVAPDGRIVAFVWTYDSESCRYLDIHRRVSRDGGFTWSSAEPLGFADQPSRPAILPDGRVVLAWVDRFGSRSIRARLAADVEAPFDRASEVVIYQQAGVSPGGDGISDTAALLGDMQLWSFGLPFAEALPDGDVLVVHYAGTAGAMDIQWARLRP